ncbi:MAG TPA: ABC transporter ATP-binding protein [Acidimicrobiales bacterium]|nr:ABC transporter ATP-binding protein [Acidimicrobiales bacterium]
MADPGAVIEVRDLTKRFGQVTAVCELSFSVVPGRVTGFLGPNGAGKTTTLRMLLGLVSPTSGTATVFGRRYRDLTDPMRRIGAVLESTSFHPSRRARDHLRMLAIASDIDERRVAEVLELVNLTDVARRRVGGFSMGMRQRLELAGAMLGDPEVLILDEPANGLDPQGIAWLRQFLRYLAGQGRTVLVSSHQLAEMAQTVDDVIILADGRLQAQAPLSALTDRTTVSMRARTPEPDRLIEVTRAAGFSPSRVADDVVVVAGARPETLGPVLADHRVVLYELTNDGSDLESVFMALTAPAVPATPEAPSAPLPFSPPVPRGTGP